MKKFFIVFFMVAAGIAPVVAQSSAAFTAGHRWSVNLHGGPDFNWDKYYSNNEYLQIANPGFDYNVDLSLILRVTNTVRFRIDGGYSEMSFGWKPNPEHGAYAFRKAEMSLFLLNFAPRVDVKLLTLGNFDMFVSPGFFQEFVLGNDQLTTKTDGTTSWRSSYVKTDYHRHTAGAVLGAVVKYNVTRHLGLTFNPDYIRFMNKLYKKNSGDMQRFRLNLGVEWTI
ncbi:MAG: hypothetical protein LBR50_05440 [Tannerella sp.]|nr:hypothetical protein [Tannerella sp.]